MNAAKLHCMYVDTKLKFVGELSLLSNGKFAAIKLHARNVQIRSLQTRTCYMRTFLHVNNVLTRKFMLHKNSEETLYQGIINAYNYCIIRIVLMSIVLFTYIYPF